MWTAAFRRDCAGYPVGAGRGMRRPDGGLSLGKFQDIPKARAGWLAGGSVCHLGPAESCLDEAGIFRLLALRAMGSFAVMQIPCSLMWKCHLELFHWRTTTPQKRSPPAIGILTLGSRAGGEGHSGNECACLVKKRSPVL